MKGSLVSAICGRILFVMAIVFDIASGLDGKASTHTYVVAGVMFAMAAYQRAGEQ